jgi:hypothetical protein
MKGAVRGVLKKVVQRDELGLEGVDVILAGADGQ